jgi:tetratricopeptide (TPR) repeat protein
MLELLYLGDADQLANTAEELAHRLNREAERLRARAVGVLAQETRGDYEQAARQSAEACDNLLAESGVLPAGQAGIITRFTALLLRCGDYEGAYSRLTRFTERFASISTDESDERPSSVAGRALGQLGIASYLLGDYLEAGTWFGKAQEQFESADAAGAAAAANAAHIALFTAREPDAEEPYMDNRVILLESLGPYAVAQWQTEKAHGLFGDVFIAEEVSIDALRALDRDLKRAWRRTALLYSALRHSTEWGDLRRMFHLLPECAVSTVSGRSSAVQRPWHHALHLVLPLGASPGVRTIATKALASGEPTGHEIVTQLVGEYQSPREKAAASVALGITSELWPDDQLESIVDFLLPLTVGLGAPVRMEDNARLAALDTLASAASVWGEEMPPCVANRFLDALSPEGLEYNEANTAFNFIQGMLRRGCDASLGALFDGCLALLNCEQEWAREKALSLAAYIAGEAPFHRQRLENALGPTLESGDPYLVQCAAIADIEITDGVIQRFVDNMLERVAAQIIIKSDGKPEVRLGVSMWPLRVLADRVAVDDVPRVIDALLPAVLDTRLPITARQDALDATIEYLSRCPDEMARHLLSVYEVAAGAGLPDSSEMYRPRDPRFTMNVGIPDDLVMTGVKGVATYAGQHPLDERFSDFYSLIENASRSAKPDIKQTALWGLTAVARKATGVWPRKAALRLVTCTQDPEVALVAWRALATCANELPEELLPEIVFGCRELIAREVEVDGVRAALELLGAVRDRMAGDLVELWDETVNIAVSSRFRTARREAAELLRGPLGNA